MTKPQLAAIVLVAFAFVSAFLLSTEHNPNQYSEELYNTIILTPRPITLLGNIKIDNEVLTVKTKDKTFIISGVPYVAEEINVDDIVSRALSGTVPQPKDTTSKQ